MTNNLYKPVLQEHSIHDLYDIAELSDKAGILEIKLVGPNSEKLNIIFESCVAYRKVDEGDALLTLSNISAAGLKGMSFYQIEKSSFVEWFVKQAFGIRNPNDIHHYAVHTIDDVIDILCLNPPTVNAN